MRGDQSFQRNAFTHDKAALDVGPTYPYSAQYKGDGWHVYDASTNTYIEPSYPTAAAAESAIAARLDAERAE
ncbi:hypothetical protein AVU67_gp11 [Ralstonia phage RSJ2]|uniref:Uncharacterized protein n=1 Tax=Ralstonia phage RSJ2 TaxID=1481785 RepID=A0A068Q6G3_9CAUD|nr:hypothetical protein AVU67_gp11 [Ralstonia phage RSJ2]BAP15817.1 hypothetical protein [Ralstonia phage RSJ2]